MTAMKLKIVSDGTSVGTRIINADTGEDLLCTAVTWSIDLYTRIAVATITVPGVAIDAQVVQEQEDTP